MPNRSRPSWRSRLYLLMMGAIALVIGIALAFRFPPPPDF